MKILIFVSCYVLCVYALPPAPPPPLQTQPSNPLNSKVCTYGPTYWCKNITTAAGCGAVKHCIQTVWEHQTLPPDPSSVCETCLEMVKEARDQLQSNETQEEIKEVFEGSCKLIPIKPIAEACIKVADEFIVELVDALASQMNPQIVCSIAGLCNNAQVQQLLEEVGANAGGAILKRKPDTCKGCRTVISLLEEKFRQSSRDNILQNMLLICGRMGSLSDACSSIVVKYFNEIYLHLEENLNPDEFCLMSGECSSLFHTHIADIQVRPMSDVGVVRIGGDNDDLPCDLCKQLVLHLRDILVANTTEVEFKKVLTGICKQTGTFKDECLNLVNDYYAVVYNFLVNDLNGTVICSMVGICKRPGVNFMDNGVPIAPLLPIEQAQKPILANDPLRNRGGAVQIIEQPKIMLLPIERIMPQTLTLMGNTQLCTFCEYFLHFVQQAITDPKTEDTIKRVVDHACDELPASVNETCHQFVDTYGPAFVAILAQEIDPAVVCPKLSLCPALPAQNVEIFMHHVKGDKPSCPMCLLAVESLEQLVKHKKTEDNLRQALTNLCSHLHGTVETECKDFVKSYSEPIIEACLAHLTPAEVCEYLRLCKDKTPPTSPSTPKADYGGSIDTNEIPDYTVNGKIVPSNEHSPLCVMCEFALSQIDKQLSDNATEAEIKQVVKGICSYLPKSVSKQCSEFVDQYADTIIQLLLQELDPSAVCTSLNLCAQPKADLAPLPPVGSVECELCKKILKEIEHMIAGHSSQEHIVHAVEHVCEVLPKPLRKKCKKFIEKHGKDIIKLLESNVVPKEVCKLIQLCSKAIGIQSVNVASPKCELCKKILEEIEHLIVDKPTEEKIINAVHHVCEAVPKLLRHDCNKFIDKHGAEIIKLLESNVVPKEVCKMLELCTDANLEDVGSPLCTVCQFVLEKIEDLIDVNVTEAQIVDALNDVCLTLPLISDDCNDFINKYGADIAHLLKMLVEPSEICEMLLICSTKFEKAKLEVRTCATCNVAIHRMNNVLQDPEVNHSLAHVLANTCVSLPVDHQKLCKTIISNNGVRLFNMLNESVNPNMVCANARLCPMDDLVVINKCTQGSSYWCLNEKTAQECGMINHCLKNVWLNKKWNH